jgi:hypothetical protein
MFIWMPPTEAPDSREAPSEVPEKPRSAETWTTDDLRRVAAVLLQIVIPGGIGAALTLMMAFVMFYPEGTPPSPAPIVVFGGPLVGFLTWLFGLIAHRASGERLVVTVLCAALGFIVSLLLYFSGRWLPPLPRHAGDLAEPLGLALYLAAVVGFMLAIAAPLAGALAGYYWVWRKLVSSQS